MNPPASLESEDSDPDLHDDARAAIDSVILSTTHHLESFKVRSYKGVVTAETVYGMNIIRELFAGIDDFIGGRSRGPERVFREGCFVTFGGAVFAHSQ